MSNIALNKKRRLTRWKKYLPYFFMVLPGILYLIIFKYIPMFWSVIAFQDFSSTRGILGSPFVGFKHFVKLFHYPAPKFAVCGFCYGFTAQRNQAGASVR